MGPVMCAVNSQAQARDLSKRQSCPCFPIALPPLHLDLGYPVTIMCGLDGGQRKISFWLLSLQGPRSAGYFVVLTLWYFCLVYLIIFNKQYEKSPYLKADINMVRV